MKKINLLSLTLGLGMLATSCNDFLDTKPAAIYSDDLVWGSAANVEAFMMNYYGTASSWYRNPAFWDYYMSDNMIGCRAACPWQARGYWEASDNQGGVNDLNSRFSYIRACNLIIERCGESDVLNPTEKTQFVAMGKLLRAMCYYDFARNTGRFIWVGEVLDENSNFNIPLTSSIAESYSYVLKDLREAIPDLTTAKLAGQPNKNFALALLSEVCLTAAAYTNDAPSLQNGKSLYQEAIDAVNQISGASIDSDYENIFNQIGAYTSSDILLAYYWDELYTGFASTNMINLVANVTDEKLRQANCSPLWTNATDHLFEAWLDYTPSQELVDAYLAIDQADGLAKPWYETSQWVNNVTAVDQSKIFELVDHWDDDVVVGNNGFILNDPNGNISDLMYNNRDARFDASILHDQSVFYGQNIAMFSYGNMTRWSTNQGHLSTHVPYTNYATRKAVYTNLPELYADYRTAYHQVAMRYSRALLNKAEAQLRLNQVSEAVATFNQTRTIHGQLPPSTASTLEEAWTDYKRERRVELFWESDWYFSLMRWGMYGGEANYGYAPKSTIPELTESPSLIEINRDRNAAFIGQCQYNNNERAFNPDRDYLFPIPQSLINANPALSNADQNPGY